MNILRNKKIQKSLISECYDPGMTKVFKKDPKILDFQSCGSVNNLGNANNPEILDLTNCNDLRKTKKIVLKIQKSLISNCVEVSILQEMKKSKNP